jgi:hypothetical protein
MGTASGIEEKPTRSWEVRTATTRRFEAGGRWPTMGANLAGNRQFVLADPDGYLWRPFRDLGVRPETS